MRWHDTHRLCETSWCVTRRCGAEWRTQCDARCPRRQKNWASSDLREKKLSDLPILSIYQIFKSSHDRDCPGYRETNIPFLHIAIAMVKMLQASCLPWKPNSRQTCASSVVGAQCCCDLMRDTVVSDNGIALESRVCVAVRQGCVCVCVKHLNRCKTPIFYCLFSLQGDTAFHWDCVQQSYHLNWIEMGYPAWPAGRNCKVVIACCSGFVSNCVYLFAISACVWRPPKPRTGQAFICMDVIWLWTCCCLTPIWLVFTI